MKIKDWFSLRWLKKTKWPERKKVEVHSRHLKRFDLPGDRSLNVLDQKWRRDAEDANRARFPNRRARLQAAGLWKKQSRAERGRVEQARKAWREQKAKRAFRFFSIFFFSGGFKFLLKKTTLRLDGKPLACGSFLEFRPFIVGEIPCIQTMSIEQLCQATGVSKEFFTGGKAGA